MKANPSIMAACAMILAPMTAAVSQPTGTATDQNSVQVPNATAKADAGKVQTDTTCAAPAKGKSSGPSSSPSASRSESVKNITRDTGTDTAPPKPKKADTTSETGDCATQSK